MMAGAMALSGNSCCCSTISSTTTSRLLFNKQHQQYPKKKSLHFCFRLRASANNDAEDCNDEECAPDKEVGKVSMEWLAGDNTKVVGTFPPRKRGWTGYIEKDTAGQTNIYSVEPAVYISESAISSGTAGSSSDGSQNTAAIVAGIALISIASASSILLQVSKNSPPPVVQTAEYSGPSLSYYINKFKLTDTIQVSASAPPVTESSTAAASQTETSAQEVVSTQPEEIRVESPPPVGVDGS